MEPGHQLKLTIEKCVFGGDGLARAPEGQVVFVPGTLPGETLIAEITAVKKNFLRAKPVRFGTVSPHRIEPAVPPAQRLGHYAYLHTTYEYETELKLHQLEDFMTQAGIDPAPVMAPPAAPPPEFGYRNKISLGVNKEGGETRIGYVGDDNQSVTPITACPLAHPDINAELARLLADPGFKHSVHHRMRLTFRRTELDGVKFWRNAPPRNSSWLKETTSAGVLSVPMDGFFQVNPGGVEILISELKNVLGRAKPRRFIDLFCGVGLFAAVAADLEVPEIFGVELSEDAIAAARYNLKKKGREDAVFFAADAVDQFPALPPGNPGETVLSIDPPRTGLPFKLAQSIAAADFGGLVYISCNPATWIRDIGRLAKGGWKLQYVRLVNQFAHTGHFEVFSYFAKG